MATKRNSEDDCYNSAFSSSSKKRRLSASYMKLEDLDALGIFYDTACTPVDGFMAMLQDKIKIGRRPISLPDEARWFIGPTKEQLTFSLDLDEIPDTTEGAGPTIEIQNLIEYLENSSKELENFRVSEMRKWISLEDDNTRLKIVLFSEWVSAAKKFVEVTKDLATRFIWCKSKEASCMPMKQGPSGSVSDKGTEKTDDDNSTDVQGSLFLDVFRCFTEIFFLTPMSGEKSSNIMHDKMVASVPDLCYYQYQPRLLTPPPVLLLFCEVKRESSLKPEKEEASWIGTRLNTKVLGQVGFELVSECLHSAFHPNVLGVICMRTEIIFVYLTISTDHYKAVSSNEDVSGKRACIHYTEAFDIMKSEDRGKILELLFWLGCVQKYDLHRYYLKI